MYIVLHYDLFIVVDETVFMELQALVIREKLAGLYESEQEWSKAAQMLSGIDLDSGMRCDSEQNFFSFPLMFSGMSGIDLKLWYSLLGLLTTTSSSQSVSKLLVCTSRFGFSFEVHIYIYEMGFLVVVIVYSSFVFALLYK